MLTSSMTRLGDFKKISETNVCSKAAQMFSDCLAISKNITFKSKTAVTTLWPTFRIFGILFIPASGHTSVTIIMALTLIPP